MGGELCVTVYEGAASLHFSIQHFHEYQALKQMEDGCKQKNVLSQSVLGGLKCFSAMNTLSVQDWTNIHNEGSGALSDVIH